MAYRGEDLDLRTPQTWAASPADLAGWSQGEPGRGRLGVTARSGPIWVDETVLACCNHAFDVAQLNRAAEVRLEHLLHALTRIEAAAESLEARGVRVATLRRESATVIASDIPVGTANGKTAPRRSDLLEDVLRHAAGVASRRNAPASVDDLLQVLLDSESNVPGLSLLARNTSRFSLQQEPHLARPVYQADPRPADYQDQGRMRLPPSGYYFSDAPRTPRADFAATPVDSIQNSRLDSLELMVRALGSDLANERKVFSGLLHEVQRDLGAQRDDTSRLGGGIFDRLQAVDAGFEKRIGDLSGSWTHLAARLQGLEGALGNAKSGVAAIDVQPLNERIGALERAVQASLAEGQRASAAVAEKVKSIETILQNRPAAGPGGTVDLSPFTSRLDVIEEGILSRETSTRDILDQLSRFRDAYNMDRDLAGASGQEIETAIKGMNDAVNRQSRELASTVLDPLNSRLEGLAGVIEERHAESKESISSVGLAIEAIAQRLVAAEQAAGVQAVRFAELQGTYAQELSEVHDALMKLNSNQHTIAGSIDTWRQEGTSMVSALGNRLAETVEKETAKPMALLEPMNEAIDRLQKSAAEREFRRSRLWYWLFGTKDWVGASWPSQAQRLPNDWTSLKATWKR